MQLYPAIDIRERKCARLIQGLFDQVKTYSDTPSDMAKLWVEKGASFLHLVDLSGALVGSSTSEGVIYSIVQAASVPVQTGGEIRSRETVQYTLSLGITRAITGIKVVQNPEFIRELVVEFGPEHIVVGVDTKDGTVAIERWKRVSSISALDLCKQVKGYGVRYIVYTDIARDGMLLDPNVTMTKKLTMEIGMDVIASGGVSSMEDLCQLYEEGIKGAIVGKVLYRRRIDLKEAVACFGWNP